MNGRETELRATVEALREHYGPPEAPPSSDPFELILWVNVAYLARPARRRECAAIAVEEFGGDLGPAIRGPLVSAKRALRRFPGVGEPGAERILLFTGQHALLAPESNGLRVLARLGFVREEKSYSRAYAAARPVARGLPAKVRDLQVAHLLLEQHGRTLCKMTAPRCGECPLARRCAYARRESRRA